MKRRHSSITALSLAASVAGLGACTAILGDFTTSPNVTDSGPGADVQTETSTADASIAFSISAPNAVFLQPGKTASVAITVTGAPTTGPIAIAASGLPAGVTAASLSIPQGSTSGNLVLTAAGTATIGTQAAASIAASATNAAAPPVTLNVTVSGPSGTVDTTFPKAIPYDSGLGIIQNGALQSDGKILLFGTFQATAGAAPQLVIRLNVDGTVDSTFQSLIFTNAAASPLASGLKGIVQPDGKILVAWTEGANSYLNVSRLQSNGALDGTWHDPTKATVSTIDQTFVANSPPNLAFGLNADGSVSYAQYVGSSTIDVWRWSSAGVADNTLGTLGDYGRTQFTVAHPVLAISDVATLLPQADGTTYFAGDGTNENGFSSQVFARTTKAYTPDPGFGPLPDAGDGTAGGWESGLRFVSPMYESTIVGTTLYTAAGESIAGCTGEVTYCVVAWTLGATVSNPQTVCPALSSGLGCNDYAARIAVGPNSTLITGGFSGAANAGSIPVVSRFTTSPLAVDTTYGTSGVAKLRASSATESTELPVAVLVSTEGLTYALTQDAQYPIQRIWP